MIGRAFGVRVAAGAAGCVEGLHRFRSGGDSPTGLRVVVAADAAIF